VREALRHVLQLSSVNALDPELPFGELGLDSLGAVEFRSELSLRIGRPLPVTLAFNYPTIHAVTKYLAGLDGAPHAGKKASRVEEIEEMSEAEAEALLDRKVSDLNRRFAR
jgi:acyl carrier protein